MTNVTRRGYRAVIDPPNGRGQAWLLTPELKPLYVTTKGPPTAAAGQAVARQFAKEMHRHLTRRRG